MTTEQCSGCGRDLTYKRNSTDYRLALRSEAMPDDPAGGAVTDMILDPPIDRPHYFCGQLCLTAWCLQGDAT